MIPDDLTQGKSREEIEVLRADRLFDQCYDRAVQNMIDLTFRQHAPLTSFLIDRDLKYDILPDVPTEAVKIAYLTDGPSEASGTRSLPLPFVHSEVKDFDSAYPNRVTIERATRRVAEKVDELLVNTLRKANGALGYGPFFGSSGTGEPLPSVSGLLDRAFRANYYGPFLMIPSQNFQKVLNYDADNNSPPVRLRDAIPSYFGDALTVGATDRWSKGGVMLVQLTPDVVRIVRALTPRLLKWRTGEGAGTWRVLTITVPQVRWNGRGETGVVVADY